VTTIEGDAALVQIQHEEKQALLRLGIVLEKGGHGPARFATRGLHLDHVGPEVPQDFGAERASDPLADVQHTNVVQRRG